MIEVNNLSKSFGKLSVLNGISFTIGEGKVVAILGPNGSGKTTLIKCILGLVIPDSGEININKEPILHRWNYRNGIGYLPQIARFPENLTVRELIHMIADLRNPSSRDETLFPFFKMENFLDKPLRSLSGGTRQKVNVILALLFDPGIYIFDEPTVGLDPVSRVYFKERVKAEKKKGKTALLSTHLLSEVEELSDEIIFLLEGKIHYRGNADELKRTQNQATLEKAIAKMLDNGPEHKMNQ